MTNIICISIAGLGCLMLLVGLCLRIPFGEKKYCRGAKDRLHVRLALLLWPGNWFIAPGCGYDLSAHTPDEAGGITCPECGGLTPNIKKLLRRRRKWRMFAPGLLLVVAAGAPEAGRLVLRPELAQALPTGLLVATETWLGEHAPENFRKEWRLRAHYRSSRNELTIAEMQEMAPLLVGDLRDDDLRWNAAKAADSLRHFGSTAVPALWDGLSSKEWQQRHSAAHLLHVAEVRPTNRLLEVWVEGLRYRPILNDPSRSRHVGHYPGPSLRYLVAHAAIARPALRTGMSSDDAQQRFLCAAIAGFAEQSELASEAVPVLLDHLRDNRIRNDAMFAARALFGLGPDAIPFLEPAYKSDDEQQRGLALFLEAKLAGPDGQSLPNGAALLAPRITIRTEDPTTLRWEWLRVPRFPTRSLAAAGD